METSRLENERGLAAEYRCCPDLVVKKSVVLGTEEWMRETWVA